MLERIKYLQNLGRFRKVENSPDFAPLTLVFSENGKGKTTLCAVLRSVCDGSSGPLVARKRLGVEDATRVVLALDGGPQASFNGTTWNITRPEIYVFDEHFIDANVYSGLAVAASHRQGVHELILGDEGVRFQKRVEEIAQEISEINTTIREKTAEIPREKLHGLDIETFCALQPRADVDAEIEKVKRSISVLSDTELIRSASHFRAFGLPRIDIDEVRRVLALSLESLEQAALAAVQAHVSSLGAGSESWLSEGERLRADSASCPFCAQSIHGSHLVNHYRAYFSDAYTSHLAKIASLRSALRTTLGGDSLATFEREFGATRESAAFWSRFIQVPEIDLDTEAIASAWVAHRDTLDQALALKQDRPLDVLHLEPSATDAYNRFSTLADTVNAASSSLLDCHTAIDAAKVEAEQGSLSAARLQLNTLLATRERLTPEVGSVCNALQEAKRQEAAAKARKQQARDALAEQRERVFGTYQATLNQFLLKLGAEFSVESLEPSDRGRGGPPSTVYYLKVNDSRVELESSSSVPGPSFGTALSSGDRNTLALAFFFATLEQRDLSNAIVVIDDPASSLDDGRQMKTIQRIIELLGRAGQLVVLSHRERILERIWSKAARDQTATIKIEPCGKHESTLSTWDADADSANDHDRLFAIVRAYAESHEGQKQQVAQGLRLLLESFLRNAFPDHYEPGKPIGTFVQHCKNSLNADAPVLSRERITEIQEFLEYANLFHHSTNQTSWRDALSEVNETELHSHAKDCIQLIKKMRGTP